MSYPLFLQPVMKKRIWGGTRLRDQFLYDIPSDQTGECWGISAHPHGKSTVKNGIYGGLDLNVLWENQRHLFGHTKGEVFPLLTKILDADQDLSIQVHPDDTYAQKVEAERSGKTECWYIIDCEKDAEIVYGHTAQSKEEFQQKYLSKDRDTLFRRLKIKPGDFFYVPSGTLHALCKGTLVLETQQNSDLTYRVYDYERVDEHGNIRELHINKALEVINFPHQDIFIQPITHVHQSTEIITYIENQFFTVQRWKTEGNTSFIQDKNFQIISVLNGEGEFFVKGERYPFFKGDHIILPFGLGEYQTSGNTEWIVSFISKDQ
ncbi:mannose-6-phosphate isomerase, type 1 [Seinonella peptonophila]|uniref:Mannose-6-phosphate isomerase n=1 Tax=Seinonella peptonophila TaxID=112248 RepID=A0A1M4ZTQ4_9BACL|nr:mannose-6-phosphate isomerase, class I [Seinonella peptonophila]SHF20986.1 mannose-6-phosphate isomerase, type 1 [Seinonella peptonophila]